MGKDSNAPDNYEVGYGKPPRHSRFQKGKSGNPAGRRPGSRGLKTDLLHELSTLYTAHINGQPTKGTKQQLMLRTLSTRAAHGDVRATTVLLQLTLQVVGADDRGTDQARLSRADQALLDEMLKSHASSADPAPSPIAHSPALSPSSGDPDGSHDA